MLQTNQNEILKYVQVTYRKQKKESKEMKYRENNLKTKQTSKKKADLIHNISVITLNVNDVYQWSPTFLAPGTSFKEDNHSLPTVRPCSQRANGPQTSGLGIGTPAINRPIRRQFGRVNEKM